MKTGLLILVAVGSTAVAQSNRDFGRPLNTPENLADGAMRGAARCVTMKVSASARRVLETPIASSEEAKRIKGLVGVARECFQPQWPAFPPTGFRNAIAEVSYRESYTHSDPAIEQTVPLPASFGVVPDDTKGDAVQTVSWQLAAVGNCVVYADPKNARELVIGPRNVDEETRRFGVLKPALQKCLGGQSTDALTARNFRGFIANALLNRAHSAVDGK